MSACLTLDTIIWLFVNQLQLWILNNIESIGHQMGWGGVTVAYTQLCMFTCVFVCLCLCLLVGYFC